MWCGVAPVVPPSCSSPERVAGTEPGSSIPFRSHNDWVVAIDGPAAPRHDGAMHALGPAARSTVFSRVLLGIATVVLLLSGCAAPPGDNARVVDAAEIVDAYDCLAPNLGGWAIHPVPSSSPDPQHPDAPEAGRVPTGFAPTSAVLCDLMANSIEDAEGRWTGVTQVTLEGDLTGLLRALSEPDDAPWPGPCTADAEFVPPLWLVDATGRAINAHYPRNGCGKTKPGVREALAGLEIRETETQKRTLVESRAALDTGCAEEWKAPLAGGLSLSIPSDSPVAGPDGISQIPPDSPLTGPGGTSQVPSKPLTVTVPADLDGMRWCRYAVEPDPVGAPVPGLESAFPGSVTLRTGRFVAGGMLDTPTAQWVANVAASDPVPRSCEASAKSFLELWPLKGGRDLGMAVTAELDGCALLYREGSGTRPLPADMHELLRTLTGDSPPK